MSYTTLTHSNFFHKHRLQLPEGLAWDCELERLLFVDILTGRLLSLSINPFDVVSCSQIGRSMGFVSTVPSKNYYAGTVDNNFLLFAKDSHSTIASLYQVEEHLCCSHRFNDGLVVCENEFWFGLMNNSQPDLGATGSLRAVDKLGNQFFADHDYIIPNGPILDSTRTLLLHSDSHRKYLYSYDYKGLFTRPSSRKLRLDLSESEGEPDGMTLDQFGNVLIAMYGSGVVSVYNPNFEFLFDIPLGHKFPTNVCFAGTCLDRLFVTYAADRSSADLGGICEIQDYYSSF